MNMKLILLSIIYWGALLIIVPSSFKNNVLLGMMVIIWLSMLVIEKVRVKI